MNRNRKVIISILILLAGGISGQQLQINRIELMPNMPQPYEMRDWRKVAIGYDSLVFNYNISGEYLPLIWENTNTINYPEHNSFGLHTVVGTKSPGSAEAINCLPAVIGASLNGINKRNQMGNDYVLMSEEWFNKRPEQNVYKNHPVDDTYDDWWYVTMPNIFFYQLYSLYPGTGDFNNQFISVANQWLQAVEVMGGKSTPWTIPYMNYRGFDLSKMEPYVGDVKEPEAAGALGWILYNAYVETGEVKYRIGAEWCIEYLNSLISNPAYELQLPYGVYAAARMNAELGTDYDISKLIAWTFDVGPLRNWGSVVGQWGGYDVSGLIGEVNGNNDYPFSMNTFEQIGALVPLVRYDDRFARAIGKWVLNAANASRLFYTNYLPDNKQDSEEWGHVYDPDSYLAHEAIRQLKYGQSPYATGDAVDGGWGETNYTLYSSSHVGILGAIIDTTNVPMILKLDLLKTDYFHTDAYPSYLYFNPYDTDKLVEFDAGSGIYDIYDAVSNSIISSGVSGSTQISIPANNVILAVVIPSEGSITYELNKTLLDGVVIDYNNGMNINNFPPRIKSLTPLNDKVLQNEWTKVYCTAYDKENNQISFRWFLNNEELIPDNAVIDWLSPADTGTYIIKCIIDDGNGSRDSAITEIKVVELINSTPSINNIKATPRKLNLNGTCRIVCIAEDMDEDSLSYEWSSDYGEITGSDSLIAWTAPNDAGNYFIRCKVTDIHNSSVSDSVEVSVRDFNMVQTGSLVLYLPFNGNAEDESGNSLTSSINGPALTNDRFGNGASAFSFDGVNDNITVSNDPVLNFLDAITVCFWMKAGEFYEREAYPISHGNWENRWKVSITNQRIRWTVKTNAGIKDLDSETELVKNKLYFVTCIYSGEDYEIYLNGELDAFSNFSGLINATSHDLTVGQVLPGNTQYNYKGILDDVRVYNYALPYSDIIELYDVSVSVKEWSDRIDIPTEYRLSQNYPNPFNPTTIIEYAIPAHRNSYELKAPHVTLKVFDVLGREIATLVDTRQEPGSYRAIFNASGLNSGIYFYKICISDFTDVKKLVLVK